MYLERENKPKTPNSENGAHNKFISAALGAWKQGRSGEVFCVSYINAVEEELKETNKTEGAELM